MQSKDFQPLRECPFCGGEVEIDMLDSENSRNVKIYSAVHCPECHQWFFKGLSKEKTFVAWNRRADHIRDTTKMVSNADRIRSMSDEELAGWVFGKCQKQNECCNEPNKSCKECTLDWLKQPVKNSPL